MHNVNCLRSTLRGDTRYKNQILIYSKNIIDLPVAESPMVRLLHKLHAHLHSLWNNSLAVKMFILY
jgi:hypothetical protein